MIFGNPWGLLLLGAIPAVLAIHLYRRRFKPLVVTGLFLYGAPTLAPAAGRRREHLRRRRSLLLEILAILAATWFLSDPHIAEHQQGIHHVYLLDRRATLTAQGTDGLSSIERARQDLHSQWKTAKNGDRWTLIASGEPPQLLCGPAATLAQAQTALAAWQADQPWHELDSGLALAVALAAGGTTTVISDREPAGLPPNVGIQAYGEERPTVGLASVRWLRDGGNERIAVQFLGQGADATRVLVLRDATREYLRQEVTLTAGQPQVITIPVPPAWQNTTLTAELLGADPYALDDRVDLLRPHARLVSWHAEELNEISRAAITRALQASGGAVSSDTTATQLIIGADPHAQAGQWSVRIRAGQAAPVLGPFLARRGEAVLSDCDASGILWSGGATNADRANAHDTGEVLLLAGETVLLTRQDSGRDRAYTLWCDLDHSTLLQNPWWPVFWANVVAARAEALPGIADPNVPCGQTVQFVLPPGLLRAVLTDPSGEAVELRADAQGRIVHPGLLRSGMYRVDLPEQESFMPTSATPWLTLAAHPLDARLADLKNATRLDRAPPTSGLGERERQRSPVALLLPLLLIAGCALGAWTAFSREEPR